MWISLYISDDISRSKDTVSFNERSVVIEDLYNKLLKEQNVKVKGIKKVSILITCKSGDEFIGGPIKGLIPVASYHKDYDLNAFSELVDNKKNLEILNLIDEGMIKLSNALQWGINEVVKKIYRQIIEIDFLHKYFEVDLKLSSDKKRKAGVEVTMRDGYAQISLYLENIESGEVTILPIIKVHSNRMFIKQIVARAKWINNNQFLVTNKTGEVGFCTSVDELKTDLFFTPKNHSEAQLVNELLIAVSPIDEHLLGILMKKKRG